ncbi:TPA: hypothetical protein ACQ431_003014 [Citrobacter murliniae]
MDTQAYRVAVMLTINDQLSRQMAIISKDANQLYLRFNKINDTIKKITASAEKAATSIAKMNKAMSGNAIASSGRGANEFAGAMKKAADSAQLISKVSTVGGFALPMVLAASGGSLAISNAARSIPASVMRGGGGFLPPGGQLLLSGPGGSGGGGRGFSTFSGWRNGVPPGGWGGGMPPGGAGSGGGANGGSHADGVANMAIAYGAFSFMKHAVDAGAEYQTMVEKFKQYGMGDAAVAEAEKFAESTKIIGASKIDMLRYFTEAQGVFRESGAHTLDEQLKGARLAAPVMAKMQVAMQGLDEHAKAMTVAKQMDMLRFVEQAGGLQSADKFNNLMNLGFKAIQSSGGNIDFTQLRQFYSKAGTSAYGLSAKALFGELEPIIGELKGSTAGDALMTSYNRLNGIIKLPNQVVHDLEKMGIWDYKRIQHNSMGGVKKFNGNPLVNSELFAESPVEYYQKMILPIYKSRKMSEEEIQRTNALIFGRTGGKMFNLIDKQLKTIEHSVEALNKSRGLDDSYSAVSGTYAGKQIDFEAKWKDFQLALAQDGGLLDTFTRGLQGLTVFLKNLTEFSNNNPKLTSASMTLLELVTAVATFKGGLWLVKHAFSALLSPMSILTGEGGIPLLSTSLGGLAGVVARLVPILSLFIPTNNTPNTTEELKSLDNSKRQNWMQNDPTKPYAGAWQDQVTAWVKAHPGQKIPNFSTDSNGFMHAENKNPLQAVQVNSSIYLDGRKIGDAVTQHMVKQGSRPPSGPSGVDSTMSLIHAGMGSLVTR